jgi:5'-deoxynucleotidase YfbR-like HD superfamily hydrolase
MLSQHSVLTLLFCLLSFPALAQNVPRQAPPIPSRGDMNQPMADEDDARNRITSEMEKKAAKERMAALKSDTDKLLKLSVELKSYVDKSNENVLSLDVIKKADEIEKLAKSVKEKMKGPN